MKFFKPTAEELDSFRQIYERLITEVCDQHSKTIAPIIAYNNRKIHNWVEVQIEQLQVQIGEAKKLVESCLFEEMMAKDPLQKQDIRKKLADAKKNMEQLQKDYPKRVREVETETQREIDEFNQSQEIKPVLMINIVLKF